MPFEPLPENMNIEADGQWRHETLGWSSQMEIAPTASADGQYLYAVGVDGREVGELRSDLGHLLLEDLCRTHPVYADGTSSGTTNYRDLTYSQVLQMEPFAISAHAIDGTRKYGFVCRWRGTGNFGQLDQPAHTPILALWVYDDATIDAALTDTGRLRLILPRVPTRTIVGATDANGHTNDSRMRHYNDKGFYSASVGGYPDRGRLIPCEDDIVVSYNDRFVYIFSTTDEFEPITIWYNSDDAGATPLHFSSAQNPGWHWEVMGPNDPGEPDTSQVTVSLNSSTGYAYGGSPVYYYKQRHRFLDYFRNRWTAVYKDHYAAAGHGTDLKSINYILTRYGTTAGVYDARDVEAAMFYRYIELFSALGSTRESIRGSFYSMYTGPTMMKKTVSSLTGVQNWILDPAGTTNVWKFVGFMNTAGQEQDIAGGETRQAMSDEGLAAVVTPIDAGDMLVYDPPQSYVLGAAHLQGVHFVATSVIPKVGGTTLPQTVSYVNSSNVVVNYSDLTTEAPEMFRPSQSYITRLDANKPFCLVACTDFMMAVGSGPIVRFRLNGSYMETIEFPSGLELLNSKAAVAVGANLLIGTTSGFYWVDPSTGAASPLGALNRVIRDLWGATASSVKMVYDPTLNAVFIVNTENSTAIKLWMEKGRVTLLEDFPYTMLGQQIISGSKRAVFCTDQGRFVYPAAYLGESDYGTVTMAGVMGRGTAFLEYPFNFSVYSVAGGGSPTFVLSNAGNTVFEEYVTTHNKTLAAEYWGGFSMYIISGSNRGRRLPIVSLDDAGSGRVTVVTDQDPSSFLAAGDYVSFSPVVFGVVGPPLEGASRGVGGTELREVHGGNVVLPLLITNGHAWAAKAGYTEWPPGSLYPIFEIGVLDNTGLLRTEPQSSEIWFDRYYDATSQERATGLPDITKGIAYDADNPATMFGYISGAGHILFPYFKSWLSNCVFRLKEWTVYGRMVPSEITVQE